MSMTGIHRIKSLVCAALYSQITYLQEQILRRHADWKPMERQCEGGCEGMEGRSNLVWFEAERP